MRPDDQGGAKRNRTAPTRLGFYIAALALLAFAALTLVATVLRAPQHVGAVEVAGQVVQMRIGLTPDPPKTGPVPVQITLTDPQGRLLPAEDVLVRYGMARQDAREIRAGRISPGLFQAEVWFSDVGAGWIEVAIRLGRSEGRLRLPVQVRPNI